MRVSWIGMSAAVSHQSGGNKRNPTIPEAIPASSGQVTRYRLNRGGDRRLNRALHTVALVRLRDDPVTAPTRPAGAPRASPREIRRCIKRAVARNLLKLLQQLDLADVEVVKVC
jgi:transposase